MNQISVSRYGHRQPRLQAKDFENMFNQTPVLTRLGGACLVCGKFVGLMAIPAVFIPALNSIAIFLVITWGGLVFTCIALCSYEHFRKKSIQTNSEKLELINDLVFENPDLRRQLTDRLGEEINDDDLNPAADAAKPKRVIQLFR
jgi:hypothetical protein